MMELPQDDISVKEVLAHCYADSSVYGKTIFPNRFRRPFTRLHHRMFNLIDNVDWHQKYIVAPRGIGKTSIVNLLLPSKRALFQDKHYIVPISATSTMATLQSENLKTELTTNPRIKGLFGNIATDTFNKEQWVIDVDGFKVCIMPRGAQQQVRGMLFQDWRPDLIIVDDLEDPDTMDSEDARKKKVDWFFDDVMNCVDPYERPIKWEVIVLGTALSPNSLVVQLQENPDWKGMRLEIADDDLKSQIPEWLSDEDIQKKYDELARAGKIETFYREFRNIPGVGGKDAPFQEHMFKRYREGTPGYDDMETNPDWETVIMVDPARTANMKSAHSAIVAISYNLKKHWLRVRDVVDEKLHPEELYAEIARMAQMLRARIIGVEVTGLHEFITYPLRSYLLSNGVYATVVELHARGGKEENAKVARGKSLIPFYRMGRVEHNEAIAAKIETPLLKFPKPPRWDVIDAASYVVELLEMGEQYPEPQVGEDDAYSTSKEEIEREFAGLDEPGDDYHPLLNFRVV